MTEPSNDNAKITPMAERMAWDGKKIRKLERQSYELSGAYHMDEINKLMDTLGIESGKFQRATAAIMGRIDGHGTLVLDIDQSGIRIDGKRAGFLEIYPVEGGKYDARVISEPNDDKGANVPDDVWAGGAEILGWAKSVPLPWLLKSCEGILGISLTEPMPAERIVRSMLDTANSAFAECDCEECAASRKMAELNGTEIADEKRKLMTAKGDHDWDRIWNQLDNARMLAADPEKAKEALARSTMLTTNEPATVN